MFGPIADERMVGGESAADHPERTRYAQGQSTIPTPDRRPVGERGAASESRAARADRGIKHEVTPKIGDEPQVDFHVGRSGNRRRGRIHESPDVSR